MHHYPRPPSLFGSWWGLYEGSVPRVGNLITSDCRTLIGAEQQSLCNILTNRVRALKSTWNSSAHAHPKYTDTSTIGLENTYCPVIVCSVVSRVWLHETNAARIMTQVYVHSPIKAHPTARTLNSNSNFYTISVQCCVECSTLSRSLARFCRRTAATSYFRFVVGLVSYPEQLLSRSHTLVEIWPHKTKFSLCLSVFSFFSLSFSLSLLLLILEVTVFYCCLLFVYLQAPGRCFNWFTIWT